MTAAQAYEELRTRGVKLARVSFSGGNDEGGADSVVLVRDFPGGEMTEEIPYQWDNENSLEGYLHELPSQEYGSFAGDFYVEGVIVVDPIVRKTTWEVQESQSILVPRRWEQ